MTHIHPVLTAMSLLLEIVLTDEMIPTEMPNRALDFRTDKVPSDSRLLRFNEELYAVEAVQQAAVAASDLAGLYRSDD